MYVMAGARSIEGDSRSLLNSFIEIRKAAKPDTALYVPALATPENVSLLVYLGADVVDDVLTTIKAYQGLYLTPDGEYQVKDMADFPCSCEACSNHAQELKSNPELLADHNRARLREELSRIKIHIRNGMLREYIEKQSRSRPWLTALMRLADAEYSYIEARTPTYRSSDLLACSAESQNRVEVRRFADRIIQRYSSDGKILLVIPCSARKPYSTSQSHMAIISALGKYRRYVREVILTSPMGVVPRELELVYPAAHYDVAVTGVWDLEERHWVSGCLRNFIDANHFDRVIAHVEGPYVEVCAQADRDMIFTSTGKVTSDESLHALVNQVKLAVDELSPQPRNFEMYLLDIFRKMADYEFGKGRGDLLVPQKGIVKGKHPRLTLFDGREQLCTINPLYGSLTLTLEGAKRMNLTDQYFVEITDFVPKGSILAPGVSNADPQIRPGDDVFIVGKKAIGVGRAKMSGWEMVEASRGMAVELKHVEPVK
jgi:archaeosine synthase